MPINSGKINAGVINGGRYRPIVELSFSDGMTLVEALTMDRYLNFAESVSLIDTPTTSGILVCAFSEILDIDDAIVVRHIISFADGLVLTDTLTITPQLVLTLAEELVLSDDAESTLKALNTIADALLFTGSVDWHFKLELAEALNLDDDVDMTLEAVIEFLESLVLGDTPSLTATILMPFADSIELDDTVTTAGKLIIALEEGLEFGGVLNTPDGVFDTWVINAETKAPWKYTNFPFNSYCFVDGKYLGLTDSELYDLTGDDDDGTDIDAVIKTGLLNFGSSLKKSIPRAYFGYTSDGKLLFKTITTDTGRKVERWYELRERTADNVTDARVKMARGVKSTYWQFEIVNVDGADFDIDNIQLLPAVLKRRV